jgi:hypothetical protein
MDNKIDIILNQFCELQFLATGMKNPPSDLMSGLFDAEDKICEYYSIPPNSINILNLADDILNYSKDKNNYVIDFNNRIKDYTELYLSSTPLTNKQILEKFKSEIYAPLVCMELNVDFHIYTDFLFSELYCMDQISNEEFLDEVKIIKENPKVLEHIAQLVNTKSKVETIEIIEEIEKYGLQYVYIFLENYENLKQQ